MTKIGYIGMDNGNFQSICRFIKQDEIAEIDFTAAKKIHSPCSI